MLLDAARYLGETLEPSRVYERFREILAEALDCDGVVVSCDDGRHAAGQHVRSYALSAQTQMQSIMESFAAEVDRLGNPQLGGSGAAASHDPLFDDLGDWEIRFRNGSD